MLKFTPSNPKKDLQNILQNVALYYKNYNQVLEKNLFLLGFLGYYNRNALDTELGKRKITMIIQQKRCPLLQSDLPIIDHQIQLVK